jgi:pimeloyl-ACP methyl ester carboxylesterase
MSAISETIFFSGWDGLKLAADVAGDPRDPPIVLLHGGGQTRHSWKNGQMALAQAGYHVVSLDARGHGQSQWAPDGDYGVDALKADLLAVLGQIGQMPILIGASLGGMTALAATGETEGPIARGLVLVDVTPRVVPGGAEAIMTFMRANPDGFETLEQVAEAVAAYNPHRPRPKDISGLRRNLREIDGRLYWHWDPAFLGPKRVEAGLRADRLSDAARAISIPTLLVRGQNSELVGEEEVAHFRELIPHAHYADVKGAGHMVAGDKNDAFNAAIIAFVKTVDG